MADAILVIGVGNALRGDDAAGLEVARRLRERATAAGIAVRTLEGEAVGLLDAWDGAEVVVLVDSVRSGAAPGVVHRLDASARPVPVGLGGSSSTHAVGVAEAIELARTLGRLPQRIVVYGIEGGRFDTGAALSPGVQAALDSVADAVLRELSPSPAAPASYAAAEPASASVRAASSRPAASTWAPEPTPNVQ